MRAQEITKAEATRRARIALSTGYFAQGTQDAYVHYASTRIPIYGSMGKRPSHGEMVRQVARAIQDYHYDLACAAEAVR